MVRRKTKRIKRKKSKGRLFSRFLENKDKILDLSTKILILAIIILSIGIYIVGKYENRIGTYLIVVSSATIYLLLILIAIII